MSDTSAERWTREELQRGGWITGGEAELVQMPCCGFTYDVAHDDHHQPGTFTCPLCEPVADQLQRVEGELARSLEWALDVLETSLARLDELEPEPYPEEHHRLRQAGLEKARGVLEKHRG